jgi:hypothetical protein
LEERKQETVRVEKDEVKGNEKGTSRGRNERVEEEMQFLEEHHGIVSTHPIVKLEGKL